MTAHFRTTVRHEFQRRPIVTSYGDIWAVVLAGGDGSRLRTLTTNLNGVAVPKQYCSLWGGASLLEDALVRGGAIVRTDRLCAVVAAGHRRWWSTVLGRLQGDNVIVQPQNRGTGIGILLALLKIRARDPYAVLLLLPADHYMHDEATMAASLHRAVALAAADVDMVYLLGAEPTEPDPELGYIVPTNPGRTAPTRVAHLVEKPARDDAAALVSQGALLDVFIAAGSVTALLNLYAKSHGEAVAIVSEALERGGELTDAPLVKAYSQLSNIDFAQDLLEGQTARLKVLPIPSCGWADLGTPAGIAIALKTPPRRTARRPNRFFEVTNLSLAAQWSADD